MVHYAIQRFNFVVDTLTWLERDEFWLLTKKIVIEVGDVVG